MDPRESVLQLTGGTRARIVWTRQQEGFQDYVGTESDHKVMAFDTEDGERVLVDTRRRKIRDAFAATGRDQQQSLSGLLRSMGTDSLDVSTDRPYMKDLLSFFRRRERRMKH